MDKCLVTRFVVTHAYIFNELKTMIKVSILDNSNRVNSMSHLQHSLFYSLLKASRFCKTEESINQLFICSITHQLIKVYSKNVCTNKTCQAHKST